MSVYVDRGMQCGHEIVFSGEGDEDFHSEAGDVIFTVRPLPHKLFRLDGIDLHLDASISLFESLTGASIKITHLDGRALQLNCIDVVIPGEIRTVAGEGFPVYKDPTTSGNLHVRLEVKFPTQLIKDVEVSHSKSFTPVLKTCKILRDILVPDSQRSNQAIESDGQTQFLILPRTSRAPNQPNTCAQQ